MRPCRTSLLPLFFLLIGIGCSDVGPQKRQNVTSSDVTHVDTGTKAVDTTEEAKVELLPENPVVANDVPLAPGPMVLPFDLAPPHFTFVPRLGGGGGGHGGSRRDRVPCGTIDVATMCGASPDPCRAFQCDETLGCVLTAVASDTTSCNDGDPCTMGDTCNGQGQCVGGMAVMCPSDNNVCTDDICKAGTGCLYQPTTATPTCSDNNECTSGDACNSGICTGTLQDCTAGLDESCQIGFCDVTDGCQVINLTGPYGEDCTTPFLGICAIGALMCVEGSLTTMCEPLVRPGDKLEVCDDAEMLDEDCDGIANSCCVGTGTFVAGSIQGQDGWTGGTIAIAAAVDQAVAQPTLNANTGIGSWRVSNSTINGNHNGQFAGWPFSPGLAVTAGQPSSGAGADLFTATFLKSANTVADGSNIEVDLAANNSDNRNSFFAITNNTDATGGLQLRVSEPDGTTGNFKPTQTIATGLSRTAWHRIDIVANFIDGDANDTFQVILDGVVLTNPLTLGTTFGTFEGFNNALMLPYVLTNRLLWRSGAAPSAFDASFVDNAAQGFFFDDVCYIASPRLIQRSNWPLTPHPSSHKCRGLDHAQKRR